MKRHLMVFAVCLAIAIVMIWVTSPCLGEGGETPEDPGDPYEIPPSKTLEPTPCTLSSFWMILVAMAFQFAF
jgi:hypothetical protein